MSAIIFNARAFGASGCGIVKDTLALQGAVDACAAVGGGEVYVPPGRYLSGTIYLKSHVTLHLASGATILGSPDREDYNADDVFAENQAFSIENVTGAHLILAYAQENVSIIGGGAIDGNSSQFFGPLPAHITASYRVKTGNQPILSWRPGQMVFFCRCKRVAVRDVALVNSTYWNLFLLGCEDVQIRGLTIDNPPSTQNGDGIDIDCSRNVTVSDCIIRSGDDCITVRANKGPLGKHALPSENITVTNCILSSPTCAIRVGVGDGEIRRCSFSHIVVPIARTAVNMVSRYSERAAHGTRIEQIHFADFTVDVAMPIVIGAGPGATQPAFIRDISFSRFKIKAWAGAQLAGTSDVPLQRIRFTDFDWHISGGTDNGAFISEIPVELSKFGYNGLNGQPALPCALYGIQVQDVTFDHIRLRWDQPSRVWQDGILLDQARDVEFRNVHMRQPRDDAGAAIHCRESDGISLQGCRAESGTLTFLRVEQSAPESFLRCLSNDFVLAENPIHAEGYTLEAGNLYADKVLS